MFKVGDIVKFKSTRGFEYMAGLERRVVAIELGLNLAQRPMLRVARLEGGFEGMYYAYRFEKVEDVTTS